MCLCLMIIKTMTNTIFIMMMVRPSKYCGSPHQRLVQRREPGRDLIGFLHNHLDHDHHHGVNGEFGVDGVDGE